MLFNQPFKIELRGLLPSNDTELTVGRTCKQNEKEISWTEEFTPIDRLKLCKPSLKEEAQGAEGFGV